MLIMNILGDWVLAKETNNRFADIILGFSPLKTEQYENDLIFQLMITGSLPLLADVLVLLSIAAFVGLMVA